MSLRSTRLAKSGQASWPCSRSTLPTYGAHYVLNVRTQHLANMIFCYFDIFVCYFGGLFGAAGASGELANCSCLGVIVRF